ncbi:MAG: alanine racemase [Rhodospirillaceae bacterium]|nr:alanine racemase [Rhodospirillaceae bacterium]|tara:strand:+ start:18195 stop:19277 length:1083 start_codon:yes stop_codon:yes gene_type:complete
MSDKKRSKNTIRDVALDAGVSIATVSRVVNKLGTVSKETEERVQQSIDRMGFRLNAFGRGLSTSRSYTIGVMIPSLSNPVFADAVSGITQEASKAGYNVMIAATDYQHAAEISTVSTFLERQIDGMILTVADPMHSDALDMLEAAQAPYALIYNQVSKSDRLTVTVDNVAAGDAVARCFHTQGHRTMAMISGSFAESDRAIARRDGFVTGIAALGLPTPVIHEVGFVNLDIEPVLQSLFEDQDKAPTALFCSNDLLAISFISGLERRGLRVPDDVSVMGFDGIAIGTHLHPTLATVVQPSKRMGEVAAQCLLCRINGEGGMQSTLLPFTLRLGESTGRACKQLPADLQTPHKSVHRRPAQ